MVRLPDTMSVKEKLTKMHAVIDDLDLQHCLSTGYIMLFVGY